MAKGVSVRQALLYVSKHPEPATDEMLCLPVHELVARTLFKLANTSSLENPKILAQARKAQELILNRIDGTRRPGSHPAAQRGTEVSFRDLTTAGEIDE